MRHKLVQFVVRLEGGDTISRGWPSITRPLNPDRQSVAPTVIAVSREETYNVR